MLVYRGPISHLEYSGFTYNGNNGYFKANIDNTGVFHTLTIQFEHFRPVDCKYSNELRCSDCNYTTKCHRKSKITHKDENGNITSIEEKWTFSFPDIVQGVITEDSDPDDYLMSLIQGYIKEIQNDD